MSLHIVMNSRAVYTDFHTLKHVTKSQFVLLKISALYIRPDKV